MNLFDVYPLFDIEPVKGDGAYIYDEKGTKYLDFYGGHAVISIGHNHPTYVNHIKDQIDKLGFYSNSVQNPLQQKVADKLGSLSNLNEYQLFFTNSGAESNENALKLASFQNGKKDIVAFKNGFHGRTSAAVNVTDNEKIKAAINKTFDCHLLEFGDAEALEEALKTDTITAVIIEGIQGVGGIYCPSESFLLEVEALCKKYNTVLILDEVQSGFGRSGNFFAFQRAAIQPDIITMAKGMGNGFPVGGILVHPSIKPSYGLLGTTFGGNHLACAATLAVLETIEQENLLSHAKEMGAYLIDEIGKLNPVAIRGEGLMLGIEFGFPIAPLRKKLIFDYKVFTGSAKNPNTLRLLPPLNVTKKEVDILVKGLAEALQNL